MGRYRGQHGGVRYALRQNAKLDDATKKENSTSAPKAETKKVEEAPKAPVSGEGNKVLSPIGGTVNELKVKVGDKVKKGQCVAIVEAMKLENEVVSEFDGEVTEILVSKGQNVTAKAALMIVK